MLRIQSLFSVSVFMCFLVLAVLSVAVQAQMTSANYQLTSSVLSGGGGEMNSSHFKLMATLGQPSPVESSAGSSYALDAGFWQTLLLLAAGDVDGDGDVGLKDVITALQAVTGMSVVTAYREADMNGDGVIGIAEAIGVLRKLGGY